MPGGIKFFVESALSLIDLQLYPVVSQRAFLGLDMLTIAPVEVEELDVSPNLRLTLQEQLLEAVPMVLAVVRAGSSLLLQTQQQQTHHNAATDTAQHSAAGVVPVAVHADENQLRDCVLRLTKSWLRQGITMSKVFDEQQPLVNVLWFGMQSGDQAAIVQGSELVADLVDIDEFPRPGSRDAAVVAIMQLLVATASTATLVAAMNDAAKGTHEAIDSSNDAVVHALCSCAIAVATKETALVAGPTHCNADFFRFLIFCSGRQRKLATLAFDTWLAIQDMPVASRHPFAQQEVYFHVLESLFALCMYPEGFHSWADCDDTDEDDFKAFRDHRQGIQEVLLACFDALQTPFFDFCREKLLRVGLFVTAADGSQHVSASVSNWDSVLSSSLPRNSSTSLSSPPLPSWNVLEAVLFVIHASMEGVHRYLQASNSLVGTATAVLPQQQQLLFEITHRIVGLTFDASSLESSEASVYLLEAVCKHIGSCTFLLVGAWQQQLYFTALGFLFNVLVATGTATQRRKDNAAATVATSFGHQLQQLQQQQQCISLSAVETHASKSIHQLVIRGAHLFAAVADDASPTQQSSQQRVVNLVDYCKQLVVLRGNCCHPYPLAGCDDGRSRSGMDNDDGGRANLLLIVEAVTRTIAAKVPRGPGAAALVSALGDATQLAAALNVEPSTTYPLVLIEARVELLLSVSGQIVRFCDGPSDASSSAAEEGRDLPHILSIYLNELWPLLTSLPRHPALGGSARILSGVFHLLRSIMINARNLVMREIPGMVDMLTSYLESTLAAAPPTTPPTQGSSSHAGAAALDAATAAVEVLGAVAGSDSVMLAHSMLSRTTAAMLTCVQRDYDASNSSASTGAIVTGLAAQMQTFSSSSSSSTSFSSATAAITDSECVEKYFGLVYNFILFYPTALLAQVCPFVDPYLFPMIALLSAMFVIVACLFLTIFVNALWPVNAHLTLVFTFLVSLLLLLFQPVGSAPGLLAAIVRLQALSLTLYKERGTLRATMQVIQSFFSPATPKVALYQTELLASGCTMGKEIVALLFFSLCGDAPSSLWPNLGETLLSIVSGCEDTEGTLAECKQWIRYVLFDSNLSLQMITHDLREIVYVALFRLTTVNRRRFKALIHDIAKICASESTSDCLLSYSE